MGKKINDLFLNRSRTKVLYACRGGPKSSAQIAEETGVDVIYVRTLLRDLKNHDIVTVTKTQHMAGNTGFTYAVKDDTIFETLNKEHEPRALMQVLGVWI